MKAQGDYTLLWQLLGQYIQRIRRIMYVYRGEVTADTGPVEITFTSGNVALLDGASDGEALRVDATAWIDYFAEPLSAENREFVEQSGKWTAFDVSHQPPYSQMIGQIVDEVTAIRTPEKKITGTIIKTGVCTMRIAVEADETYVDIT